MKTTLYLYISGEMVIVHDDIVMASGTVCIDRSGKLYIPCNPGCYYLTDREVNAYHEFMSARNRTSAILSAFVA